MRRVAVWVAVVVALAGFAGGAAGAEGRLQPMLDTGGHMALIGAITFTPDGAQLVSASDDKTVRVWDVATGKTVRTIRGEVAPGPGGKIYAMALSPDGKWLAVGGWFAPGHGVKDDEVGTIRLYDFASGKLVALLQGHENAVLGLAFSLDGRHLISGSGGGDFTAIIWDVETRQMKHRLRGHKDDIYAVGFTPDGQRAVTGSDDNDLRLWRVADGGEIAHMPGHGDKASSLAVAPDGTIASGDDSGEIRLWDGKTGAFAKVLARQKTAVGSLSFSPDGKVLLSGTGEGPGGNDCHVYDLASGREIVTYRGHDNLVGATAISPDGRWAATGGGNNKEIHIWDLRTGERRLGPEGQPLTLGGTGRTVWAVGFSADGRGIGWGNLWESHSSLAKNPLQYALTLPSGDAPLTGPVALTPHPDADASALSHKGRGQEGAAGKPSPLAGEGGANAAGEGVFLRAIAQQGGWSLSHRKGGKQGHTRDAGILDIKQDGRVVASIERGSTDGYQHRAYSFTPNGETIISGGMNGNLTAYDRAGKKIGEFTGHEGDVFAVATSPDGRYLVSGSNDQTMRLWNLKTRELLVTLFHDSDGEWVMWTPEGFYAASDKGASLVGWQINQGPDKEARYVSAAQLRKVLHRPDLVAAKILGDPDGLVKAAAARLDIDELIRTALAPTVAILSPTDGTALDKASVTVKVRVTDQGGGVSAISFKVNGQEKEALQGEGLADTPIEQSFDIAASETTIEVTAIDRSGKVFSEPAKITVKTDPKIIAGVGNLYVLALGVNRYKNPDNNLRYAVIDAKTMAETLQAAGANYYRDPQIFPLFDDDVTAEKVEAAFKALGGKVKATDVFVLYMAGHGMTIDGDYHFLPGSVDDFTAEKIKRQGFGPEQLSAWFRHIKAEKSIFIFDTCYSGSAAKILGERERDAATDETAWLRMKSATGRTIFMASSKSEKAKERADLNHGVFTYAFLEGLAKAGNPSAAYVEVTDLKSYVPARVMALNPKQTPYVPMPGDNYPLVRRYPQILAQLEKDKGAAAKIQPTHFATTAIDVFATPSRDGPPKARLTQMEQVRVLEVKEGVAHIAQDGAPIGYAEAAKLLPLDKP